MHSRKHRFLLIRCSRGTYSYYLLAISKFAELILPMDATARTPVCMKACTKCGVEKELSGFHKHATTKDGLSGQCKECIKSRDAIRNATPERKAASKARNSSPEMKAWFAEYRKTPKGKAAEKARAQTPEFKAKAKQYRALESSKEKMRAAVRRHYARKAQRDDSPWIYGLVHPITRVIYYVGQTNHTAFRRYQHRNGDCKLPKVRAAALELREQGLRPEFVLLRRVQDHEVPTQVEREVIAAVISVFGRDALLNDIQLPAEYLAKGTIKARAYRQRRANRAA